MPGKLRTFVHALVTVALALALLRFGLVHLPAAYGLLWMLFVTTAFVWALHLVLGWRASDSKPKPGPHTHRLTRSRDHYWVAGVCGGIAEFLGWQPGTVRALWMIFSLLFAGIGGVLIYIILALAMPLPPARGGKFRLDDFRVQ